MTTMSLTLTNDPQPAAEVPGVWEVCESVTFHNRFGGWHMRFGGWKTFPIPLTLLGVADHIARAHLREMGADPSMTITLVYVTPDGVVDKAVAEVRQ